MKDFGNRRLREFVDYLEYHERIHNDAHFCKIMGKKSSQISALMTGGRKVTRKFAEEIKAHFPDLNPDFLVDETCGQMLVPDSGRGSKDLVFDKRYGMFVEAGVAPEILPEDGGGVLIEEPKVTEACNYGFAGGGVIEPERAMRMLEALDDVQKLLGNLLEQINTNQAFIDKQQMIIEKLGAIIDKQQNLLDKQELHIGQLNKKLSERND